MFGLFLRSTRQLFANPFFQWRQMVADAQRGIAQHFHGRVVGGEKSNHRIGAVIQGTRVHLVFKIIHLQ